MKFARYGEKGLEKPALVDAHGQLRDLSAHCEDVTGEAFESGLFEKIAALDPESLPVVNGSVRIGPCVGKIGNFIAIGLNYTDHAEETNAPIPTEPILFNKARSCVVGPYDDVVLPPGSQDADWEVELAFLIGRRTYRVSQDNALQSVAGYFVCNDVSERDYQLKREGQWMKGKCCPTFGPIGPWLVTPDEVGDPQNLSLWLDLNDERFQDSHTSKMIFPIAEIVSYLSHFMILEAGDIVTTGTPPGVGLGMKPERYLKAGDEMRLSVEGLGEQRQKVVAFSN
ncbi:fumarylacetoacetate hydrolase family protein [Fulvimarina sp. 2208YS6-2-32]|uniref:Fumarylacetoacetate hydrolase family protein n=1 Tax=Fulvimarina uroteuthidis TaxID=3098149 RepID=A0ABU5I1N4_9HYPH|nr:fumarylacetoacetate hydrolase family protein [Fulvimarina sp. 2208YS6-2-32]MDY8108729.1 fumarylacetoacetate hydrolase family protein [Fulvimarina sp. 2208YS6-2-32]